MVAEPASPGADIRRSETETLVIVSTEMSSGGDLQFVVRLHAADCQILPAQMVDLGSDFGHNLVNFELSTPKFVYGAGARVALWAAYRLPGYAGQRAGEAKNPAVEEAQLTMLLQLVQTLLQMVAQIAMGKGVDVSSQVASAQATLGQMPTSTPESSKPLHVPVRQVRAAPDDGEWQQAQSAKRRR